MKIGILTQPLQNNYGGLLQNYALQQTLIRLGHTPVTIDHGAKSLSCLRTGYLRAKQYVMHYVKPSIYKKQPYRPTEKELRAISCNSLHFIEEHIRHTVPFRKKKELNDIISEGGFEAYVVGSDQCWRPLYSGGFLPEMYLNFVQDVEGIKRVAYAASFGTDIWEYSPIMTEECRKLAGKFDCISVREDSGVSLCKEYLHVEAKHVLDPTMLLGRKEYELLAEEENVPRKDKGLFHYILDPNQTKSEFIERTCKEMGLRPFTVLPKCQAENRTKYDFKYRIGECVYPSVASWLKGFVDAEYVIVDSFHGAVFSIIFNKPFWVISNSKRGNARFTSLLKSFKLQDRLLDIKQLGICNNNKSIDWESVNEKRRELVQKSLSVFDCLKI